MRKILLCFLLLCSTSLSLNAQCLSGIYTIGGATPDFPTFNAAVSSLIANSVCGPVIFNVRAGTYTEQITIPQIAGTSATKSITFQSESGDSSSVILAYPSSSVSTNNFVVFLNGGDHITFKKMTVDRTGTLNNSRVIHISNNSDTLVIKNNKIINHSFAGASSLIYSNDINSLHVINNILENGDYGVYIPAASPTLVIDSNTFVNSFSKGIYLSSARDLRIRYNTMGSLIGGIAIVGGYGNVEIIGNTIQNGGAEGLFMNNFNLSTSNSILIANNIINSTTALGINLVSCNNAKVLFNTVRANSNTYNPMWLENGNNTLLYNNIFYSVDTTPAFIHKNATFTSDNNLYYSNGPTLIRAYYIGGFPSLPLWVTASGKDVNSFEANVAFISPTDLHILYDNFLFNKAVFNALVTKDIDGELRTVSNPCIGADEFQLPLSDARISDLDSASDLSCGGFKPVIVHLHNGGQSALTNAVINWSVNNILQTPYNWSGSIPPTNSESNINIGSYNFLFATPYTIKIWPGSLSTGTDVFPINDTLIFSFTPNAMSGVYTVGGSSPDYATLSAAYNALLTRGICSSVIFNLRPGTYTFTQELTHITGASRTKTITFKSENDDSLSVTINSFVTAGIYQHSISINSGDNYIFKYLTLYSPTGFSPRNSCFEIKGFSSNNKISNCYMYTGLSTSSSIYDATVNIVGTSVGTELQNNWVDRMYNGYSLSSINSRKVLLRNNYFKWTVTLASSLGRDTIQNNFFGSLGIVSDSSTVDHNTSGGGMYVEGKYLYAYNNFITGRAEIRGRRTTFVHNTVKGHSTSYGEGLVEIYDSSIVQNNIFYYDSFNSYYIYSMYSGDENYYANCNWNTFYSVLGNYIRVGVTYYTLSGWKTFSGHDLNSITQNPNFVSPTDLHIYSPGAGITGMPSYPFCIDDIDGDPRTIAKAGADEFGATTGTFDGAMNEIVMGANICYGYQPINIKLYNNESAVTLTYAVIKWQVNGVNQPNYSWSGAVSGQDTSSVFSIGNYFFNGGSNTIKIWITVPNGFTDPDTSNDTLMRSSFINYPVSIGADTTICEGTSLTLNAGTFSSYLWSSSDTSSSITAYTGGNYSVSVVDSNSCPSADTINIFIPITNFGNDTTICASDSMQLDAGINFISYVWSTGDTTQTITAFPGNTYWVTAFAANSCTSQDTITIGSYPLPTVFLGNDTIICANALITLSPGVYSSYLWTGGATGSSYTDFGGRYGVPETYWVEVSNSYGCTNRDSIDVYAKEANVTILCTATGATLDAGPGSLIYTWLGYTTAVVYNTQAITVTTPEIFVVVTLDSAGCEATSEVNVSVFSPLSSFTYTSSGFLTRNFTCPVSDLIYLWDFGDGTTSTMQYPIHTFPTYGAYLVTLTVSNDCGTHVSSQMVYISNVGINDRAISDDQDGVSVYPNPYFGLTNVSYILEKKSTVNIEVFNTVGQKIAVIVDEDQPAGEYQRTFNAGELGAGVYFMKITIDGRTVMKRIVGIR